MKKFAQLMVTDHTGVNKQAVALVTKLKVTPQDNDTSKSLKAGGEKNVANLKTLKGAAFDKAYVDQEVAYHQAVIDAVDKTLDPQREQRRVEGAAGQGAPCVRHPPRAREAPAGVAGQEVIAPVAALPILAISAVTWIGSASLARAARCGPQTRHPHGDDRRLRSSARRS